MRARWAALGLLLASGAAAQIPAFPGAEGFGATALQSCRALPLNVIEVTTLANSGDGSFQAALEDSTRNDRYNIITFRVAGYITQTTRYEPASKQCIYIAGQTAPAGGITLRGISDATWAGIRFVGGSTADIVIRHLRFRRGYRTHPPNGISALIFEGQRIMLDHVSISWAGDYPYNFGTAMPDSTTDITVQHSISAEASQEHSTGGQFTGTPRETNGSARFSLHRSLWTGNSHRNPQSGVAGGLQFVNNVVYNWKLGALQTGSTNKSRTDVINSYFKRGPMTDSRFLHVITVECSTRESSAVDGDVSIFARGNIGPTNLSILTASPDSQWGGAYNGSGGTLSPSGGKRIVGCYNTTGEFFGDSVHASLQARADTMLPPPADFPIADTLTALAAFDTVMLDVGANRMVDCSGSLVYRQDAVDQRLIGEVGDSTGITNTVLDAIEAGGFPAISTGPACTDTDNDGLPDTFEQAKSTDGSATSLSSEADSDGDGYLNLEEYLNGTDPTVGPGEPPPGARFWVRRDSLLFSIAEGDSVCTPYLTGNVNYVVVARNRTIGCVPGGESIIKTWNDSIAEGHAGTIWDHPLSDAQLDSICAVAAWNLGITGCVILRARPAPDEPIGMLDAPGRSLAAVALHEPWRTRAVR